MKTPISDFKLRMQTLYELSETEELTAEGIEVILQHEDLPIRLYRKIMFSEKFIKSQKSEYLQDRVNNIIHKLYEELLVMSENNVCQLPIEQENGKYIYIPEWDENTRQWFILNPEGEKCYTFKKLIGIS